LETEVLKYNKLIPPKQNKQHPSKEQVSNKKKIQTLKSTNPKLKQKIPKIES